MKNNILNQMQNYKGGFVGVIIVLVITIMVYFIGFMTALGNDTPTARKILDFVGSFIIIANPLWTCPLAYAIGAIFIKHDSRNI